MTFPEEHEVTTAHAGDAPLFPFEGDVFVEPDQLYARLRAERPVCRIVTRDGSPAWLVTKYDDAKKALTDPRFTRGDTVDEQTVRAMSIAGAPGRTALIYADPPDLTESRKQISYYFNARKVEKLRPRAQEIVDDLIDSMTVRTGPVDLLEHLARPLPMRIICELLGIPASDSERIRSSVELLLAVDGGTDDELRESFGFIYRYLGDYLSRLREYPGDDLLSDLIHGETFDPSLTDEELVGLAMLLFITGHETTMTQIVNSCLVLLQHDEQWSLLQRHPELIETCVEELLRFVPLGHAGLPFAVSEDLEFSGVRMRKGDLVFVSKLSSNRDEEAFASADTLDITRTPNKHIAFSHGPHYCLGAALARMEMQVLIGTLCRRIPDMRLASSTSALEWRTGNIQRGPKSLPILWSQVPLPREPGTERGQV